MTRSSHILPVLLAMLLMALAGAGCVEPLWTEDKHNRKGVELPLQIYLPTRVNTATKAISDGPVEGLAAESALYSLQVWAFSHPDKSEQAMSEAELALFQQESSIAYLNVPDVNVLSSSGAGSSIQVGLLIPDYVLSRSDDALKLDFYVLGNGASIGLGDVGVKKRSEMRDLVFEGNYFGVNATRSSEIPATGLPLACFFDNRGNGYDIAFLKTDPNPTEARMEEMGRVWPEMELTRSVARMRFLFAQATGMTGNAIDSVVLFNFDDLDEPGLIPTGTYVFPREDASAIKLPEGSAYETLSWGSYYSGLEENIGQMDDPTILCSNSEVMRNMSAQFFEDYLQQLFAQTGNQNKPTSKVLYLRESDKPIKGRIYYNGQRDNEDQIVKPSQSVEFTMAGLGFPDRTNFYRNHSWTVYAYMIGQHMEVDVRLDDWVVPWTRQEVNLMDTVMVNVDQDGKFITDATMQADSLRYYNGNVIPKSNGKPRKKWFNVPIPEGDEGVTGRVVIYAPQNGKLIVTPVAVDTAEFWPKLSASEKGVYEADPSDPSYVTKWFDISMTTNVIDRRVDEGSGIPGLIGITVKRKNPAPGTQSGRKAIKLSFEIEVMENGQPRRIAADSELIDDEYHFIIP